MLFFYCEIISFPKNNRILSIVKGLDSYHKVVFKIIICYTIKNLSGGFL